MEIKIAHLYPDLLNLYGDKGNIAALTKRLEWRGIDTEIKSFSISDELDFSDIDIVFLGGGSDREHAIVSQKLCKNKLLFKDYIENNGVMLTVCGGFQLMGHYVKTKDETLKGLGILDFYTDYSPKRIMGKIVLESSLTGGFITGFENHMGKTVSSLPPLGKVVYGKGNNGKDKKEGAVYKNTIGTNLHGPLLPANPELTDYILQKALCKKYGECEFAPLDDSEEMNAKGYIISKLIKA